MHERDADESRTVTFEGVSLVGINSRNLMIYRRSGFSREIALPAKAGPTGGYEVEKVMVPIDGMRLIHCPDDSTYGPSCEQ